MDKVKIQALLDRLNSLDKSHFPDASSLTNDVINKQFEDFTAKVKQDSTVKSLETLNSKLEQFKKDFDLKPVSQAINDFQTELQTLKDEVSGEFQKVTQESEISLSKVTSAIQQLEQSVGVTDKKTDETLSLLDDLKSLRDEFGKTGQARKSRDASFSALISGIQNSLGQLSSNFETFKATDTEEDRKEKEEIQKQFAAFENQVKDLKIRFQQQGRGGSMNRLIAIGGNNSVLGKYTDLNLKAGAGTTITYANNNTTRQVDVTFTGSAGTGIVRTVATTTVSSTVGAVASTDYVVLANGGVQITLPTAVGNSNLVTVKNIGTSSVLVNTVSAQTIDGATTLIMPVQYTSVDLISDSANWDLT